MQDMHSLMAKIDYLCYWCLDFCVDHLKIFHNLGIREIYNSDVQDICNTSVSGLYKDRPCIGSVSQWCLYYGWGPHADLWLPMLGHWSVSAHHQRTNLKRSHQSRCNDALKIWVKFNPKGWPWSSISISLPPWLEYRRGVNLPGRPYHPRF